MKRLSKGFTLIELLIVIAIIGILAVAILSAINPVEQIAKANDSAKKSDAAEYLNAVERYYATFQCYPWEMVGVPPLCTPAAADSSELLAVAGSVTVESGITELINKNELKPQFANRTAELEKLTRTHVAITKAVMLGFVPDSKTFKATAKYATVACAAAGTVAVCIPE